MKHAALNKNPPYISVLLSYNRLKPLALLCVALSSAKYFNVLSFSGRASAQAGKGPSVKTRLKTDGGRASLR